ncbi:OmpA family protein [Humitalea sp. 24SJ18S-53]|uniref:OmpA family protein n=1 Tax=Humitalea sp. 24SJ18S-53 TaxID=3422307 RepID=UPI003D672473
MRRFLLTSLALMPLLAACASSTNLAGQPPRVIFFGEEGTSLDDAAKAVIADAANLAKANPLAPVRVLGFADPEGSVAYNRALSRARAENVAEALREDGVPAGRIIVGARGPVPFEAIALESRRVEIRVGL